jgi:UDP-GlcNAc:undecaprenyl-phosphate/decaprenyl-phosphate GlcNAc-1-phosphate transferase
MRSLVLALAPVAFVLAVPMTWLMMRLGHGVGAFDSTGVPGQIKAPARRIPNTGGIAIFWAIVLPMIGGLWVARLADIDNLPDFLLAARGHLAGIRSETPMALALLACLFALHILGLTDDRKPLGPWVKLGLMAAAAVTLPALSEKTRLLTLLDAHVGGPWLSIAVTALWIVVVTNAMNFMDNMDGLSAGVAAVAGGCFLAAAMLSGQWFVGACLALLIGACAGFLVFNFPRKGGAKVFMGDGGSLVLGFLLAFLTVRTTYIGDAGSVMRSAAWYGVLMPLVVLAVPLYDFLSVVVIRLSQGRSPFVGDTQHLSHRLVNLGLSRRSAVAVIYGLTAITGVSGIVLGSLQSWQAVLVGVQTVLILLVVAMFEYARARGA